MQKNDLRSNTHAIHSENILVYPLNAQVLYQSHIEHDVIMEQGQLGETCFVLLAGSCDARIRPQHDSLEEFNEEDTPQQYLHDCPQNFHRKQNGDNLVFHFKFCLNFNTGILK